jgi:hypothetical protein
VAITITQDQNLGEAEGLDITGSITGSREPVRGPVKTAGHMFDTTTELITSREGITMTTKIYKIALSWCTHSNPCIFYN